MRQSGAIAGLVVTVGGFAFLCYTGVQCVRECFGFAWTEIGRALVSAIVLVGLCLLPIMFFWHLIARFVFAFGVGRRWRQGRCPNCRYPMPPKTSTESCVECGVRLTEPTFKGAPIIVQLGVAALALVIGCAVGEGWLRLDETSFRNDVTRLQSSVGEPTAYRRARWWPNGSSALIYEPGRGFRAVD